MRHVMPELPAFRIAMPAAHKSDDDTRCLSQIPLTPVITEFRLLFRKKAKSLKQGQGLQRLTGRRMNCGLFGRSFQC